MKQFLIPLVVCIMLTAGGTSSGQVLKAVNYDELKSVVEKNDDVLYVVNFWATWCLPCVAELPGFMEVNAQFGSNPKFKMILVSLDHVKGLETTVKSFLAKKQITVDVYLLNDNKRMNVWIPAIDPGWSGAIPATVFYKNGRKLYFIEDQINKSTLEQLINQYL